MKIGKRLPRKIRYLVTVMELGKATRNSKNVPATPLEEIMANLDKHPYREIRPCVWKADGNVCVAEGCFGETCQSVQR